MDVAPFRRRLRLIALLHVAERAGLTPLRVGHLHRLAYFSNVLAPVWDIRPLDGKILKRHGGPFYPALQRDLDALVGSGTAIISGVGHVLEQEERWRLEGSYRLNHVFADPILEYLGTLQDERELLEFLQELTFAVSALSDEDLDAALSQDATYSDPVVDFENVIDFGEWQQRNFTASAARRFERVLPEAGRKGPGEQLHLYVRHLHARMHGGH
jgi:hypothetical protein